MQSEHIDWFAPGSVSLSFTVFAIFAVIIIGVVFGLVRYLAHRPVAGGAHH